MFSIFLIRRGIHSFTSLVLRPDYVLLEFSMLEISRTPWGHPGSAGGVLYKRFPTDETFFCDGKGGVTLCSGIIPRYTQALCSSRGGNSYKASARTPVLSRHHQDGSL